MLDEKKRIAILELHGKGHGLRPIAKLMGISRTAVRNVVNTGTAGVPCIIREQKAEPYRDDILELYYRCKGNLVRVHECLLEAGAELSYQALTAFCRRHDIGHKPKQPAGQYHFGPGEEMQHDTSPHEVEIGGRKRKVQTASMVLCYSRMLYFQFYPTFNRFHCKVFLTDALCYFGASCNTCMIDNTHVVVLKGTGADMVPVPEMKTFADRYGFEFEAHEKGDADRSGRVERPFSFIEQNFLANRQFDDWEHANNEAALWCDKVNASYKKHIIAVPRNLFAVERPQMKALPHWIPDVYLLHNRLVDIEGYVCVNTNRYSVPADLLEKQVEVRELKDRIEIFRGPRLVASHQKLPEPCRKRRTLPGHHPRRSGKGKKEPSENEKTLLALIPELAQYIALLKDRSKRHGTLALRRLLQMVREYPRQPLLDAITTAATYGMCDLNRLEKMILQRIAHEYFVLDAKPEGEYPHE